MSDGQFYGEIVWRQFMAPFYGVCVLGLRNTGRPILKIIKHHVIHKSYIREQGM